MSGKGGVVLAVVAILAAAGAGVYALQLSKQLDATRSELSATKADLEKSRADLAALTQEANALRKEAAELKLAADQLRVEVETSKAFLDAEKAVSMRLRAELTMAREMMAAMARPRGAASFAPPRLAPPPPMVIRAGPAGMAIGAPQQAR